MVVIFKEENHKYESDPPKKWISATKIVEMFSEPFDSEEMAWRCAESKKSKWFGMDPAIIRAYWDSENERSTTAGSKFHLHQEKKAILGQTKWHRNKRLWVCATPTIGGIKIAREQRLESGCYLEHICYSEEHGIIGQTDLMLADYEFVDVGDYKTNKEIKKQSYSGEKYGKPTYMLGPMSKYEDCNYWHYTLQLSIYMRLALIKNPLLQPGELLLYHVQFKVESRDRFDFPILSSDSEGNPIVEKVKKYSVPYLEKETAEIFEFIKAKNSFVS